MLSLPDFKEKQILFARAEWGARAALRFQNDNIVFLKDGQVVDRVSCHKVFAVFVSGDIMITSRLLQKAAAHAVSVFFMRNNFEVAAPFVAAADGNYLLRMKQYALAPERELAMAKAIVKNKAENQYRLLKSRGAGEKEMRYWEKAVARLAEAEDDQKLLGMEGELSRRFFSSYFRDIGWYRRMPRVKPDIPNFLLDMGYTYLFNITDALLRLHGFDTYKGVYHKLFFQRKSLACDLVEPFRCVIDKTLLKAYHLKQIHQADFSTAQRRVALSFDKQAKYAGIFLQAVMDRKEGLFAYVHDFYRHIMDAENPFPSFVMEVE